MFLLTGSFLFHHRTQNLLTGTCLITKWTNLANQIEAGWATKQKDCIFKGSAGKCWRSGEAEGMHIQQNPVNHSQHKRSWGGGGRGYLSCHLRRLFRHHMQTLQQDCWGKVTPPPYPSAQGASFHCSTLCGAKLNLKSSNIDPHRCLHCSWLSCELHYSSYPRLVWGKSMWFNVTWRTL